MLEKAKASFRHRVKMAENAVPPPTRYSTSLAPSEAHSIEGPSGVESLLEFNEASDPVVKNLAAKMWPLDRPLKNSNLDSSATPKQQELAESLAANVRGYLSAEEGDKVKVSYVKFPVESLGDGETVHAAWLVLRKVSGPESPASVSVTGCDYHQDNLTFETRPEQLAMLTSGQKYPALNDLVKISLNPAVVEQYLHDTTQICLEIGGGGKSEAVMYDSPHIKLDIEKPAAPKADVKPISLETGVTPVRRRRTALPLDQAKTNQADKVEAAAKNLAEQAGETIRAELEHRLELELPSAVEAKKATIIKAMTQAHKKRVGMEVELLKADPTINDEVTQQETEKQMQLLQEDIDSKFPARLEAAKASLKTQVQAELKQSLAKKYHDIVQARIATEFPKQLEKTLTAFKHEKLDAFEKTPLDTAKMNEEVTQQLAAWEGNLDLNDKASKYAEYKVGQEVRKQVTVKLAEQLYAKLRAAAQADAQGKLETALENKEAAYIQEQYNLKLQETIAQGGENAASLQANTPAGDQARNDLKAEIKKALPSNWKDTQKQATKNQLENEAEERLKPGITKSLKASLTASLTSQEKTNNFDKYRTEYINREKPKRIAAQKKALEENYKQQHMKAEVEKAEKSGSLISKAEMDHLKEEVQEKVNKLEKEKGEQEQAEDYQAQLESEAYESQVSDRMAALPNTVMSQLKKELTPGYKAAAATEAQQKIATLKAEKVAAFKAQADEKLESNIAAATNLARLRVQVRSELEKKMESDLKLKQAEAAKKQIMDQGLDKQIAKSIKHDYAEGTLKEALAYVKENFEPKMLEAAKKDAENRAHQNAVAAAQAEIDDQRSATAKDLRNEYTAQGAPGLQEEIDVAVQDMSEEDAEKIKKSLTDKFKGKVEKEVQKQLVYEMHDITEKEVDKEYQRLLPPELKVAEETVKKQVQAKAQAVADGAIQRQIKQQINQVEEPPEKAPVQETSIPQVSKTQQEKNLVTEVAAKFQPAPQNVQKKVVEEVKPAQEEPAKEEEEKKEVQVEQKKDSEESEQDSEAVQDDESSQEGNQDKANSDDQALVF
jgi:hypothetical protein